MNFRAFKSLTFFVGLILFIGAFIALVLAGNLFNPAPYKIVVAKTEIPMYSTLTPDMLAVDEQTMNPNVAKQLIHEDNLTYFLGGTVVESVHAGEPLRVMSIVSADSPGAAKRLSLALDDPNKVAMVIPVTPDIIPDNVLAGDYVNIQLGVGQIPQDYGSYGDYGNTPPDTTTKEDVTLPFAKIVLQNIPILQVDHEQVPNPNYGSGFSDQPQNDTPYIDGELQRITVLIPQEAQEMLAFAIENGSLRMSLVPLVAVKDNLPLPTDGVTWDDFLKFFKAQREASQQMVASTTSSTVLSGGKTPVTSTMQTDNTQTATLTDTTITTDTQSATSNTDGLANAVAEQNNPGVIRANNQMNKQTGKTDNGTPSDVAAIDISSLILPGVLCLGSIIILLGGMFMLKAARNKKQGV